MRVRRYRELLLGSALAALLSAPLGAQPLPALEEGPVLAAPESQIVEPLKPAPKSDPDTYSEIIAAPPTETVEGLIAGRLSGAKENADLLSFYKAHNHAPLWVADGRLNDKALAVIARIKRADEDGLDSTAFVLPDPDATKDSPELLAAAEISLSRAVAAFARQARGGRLVPSSLGPLITPEPERPSRPDVLKLMAEKDDAADWLDTYNPPHEGFRALKKKLAELRAAASEPAPPPPPEIPGGTSLKPGAFDPRVPLLRVRLGLPKATTEIATADGETAEVESREYDEALVAAVESFQTRNGLNADGIVGNQTIAMMNDEAKIEDPIPLVLANMERWRWLPRRLGQTHIFVNVPEFMARIVRSGAVIHETRVITGSKQHPSPIFSDEMDHIIVNPSWNVPASIAIKEMLPQLQKDPYYLERQGFEVTYAGRKPVRKMVVNTFFGTRTIEVRDGGIDWANMSAADMNRVRIRQPPGERNALGHIKFMFPNKHAVYLHDTPTRHLFAKDTRALSHGCIRVQDPFKLADVLLEDTSLDGAKLKAMVGGGERRIDLAHKIPIHIAYFTAEVLPDGSLLTRPDVYGTDKKMKAALGLGGQVSASATP